ncbi:hypothetical protein K438DRAFT_1813551 [Mycena galopus ATCC 62051]|nr:hypothetical protein K438DRAFT_1813551 [Mycena galopus ATCC 62051]
MRALCIAGRSWATWYHNYQHVLGKESACEHLRWRSAGVQHWTPSSITIHPVALFSLLDHYLSRNDEQPRVIGTLLGTRSSDNTQIHVRSSFAMLYSENEEQGAVVMEYHHTMYELQSRVTPKETIVGWFETAAHQAIHVALNTGAENGEEAGISESPMGVFPKPENCISVPVPVHLQFQDAERSGRAYSISSS